MKKHLIPVETLTTNIQTHFIVWQWQWEQRSQEGNRVQVPNAVALPGIITAAEVIYSCMHRVICFTPSQKHAGRTLQLNHHSVQQAPWEPVNQSRVRVEGRGGKKGNYLYVSACVLSFMLKINHFHTGDVNIYFAALNSTLFSTEVVQFISEAFTVFILNTEAASSVPGKILRQTSSSGEWTEINGERSGSLALIVAQQTKDHSHLLKGPLQKQIHWGRQVRQGTPSFKTQKCEHVLH